MHGPDWTEVEVVPDVGGAGRRRRHRHGRAWAVAGASAVTLVVSGAASMALGAAPSALAGQALSAIGGLGLLPGTAAGATPDASPEASPQATDKQRTRGFESHPHGLSSALHGSFVVSTADGYRTVHVQRGEVDEVDASSIRLTSADGFSQTYLVDDRTRFVGADGIEALSGGDTVGVMATEADGSLTADVIVDRAALEQRLADRAAPGSDLAERHRHPHLRGPRWSEQAPTVTPQPSAQGSSLT